MTSGKFIISLPFREKRLLFAAASSIGSKLMTVLVSVISLPLAYNSLGTERYGMMIAITSVAGLLTFSDLGLGFALQNKVPALLRQSGSDGLRKAIATTFFFLLATSVVLLIAFWLVAQRMDWATVLNLKSEAARQEVNTSIWCFVLTLALAIPFSVVQKLQIGLQEGHVTNFWIAAGNICSLVALLVVCQFHPTTPALVLALYGPVTLFVLVNFLVQFLVRTPHLFPRIHLPDLSFLKALITEGSLYFGVQVLAMLLFASNTALLVRLSGPEAVTVFTIAYKLVLLLLIPLEASAPYLTPAVNDAASQTDFTWVRKTVRRSVLISLGLAVLSAAIIYLFGNLLLGFWLGTRNPVPPEILGAVSVFMLLYANLGCTLSFIMLSGALIRLKMLVYSIAVLSSLATKYWLIKSAGVEGAFWSTSLPMFVLYVLPCLYILKKKKML